MKKLLLVCCLFMALVGCNKEPSKTSGLSPNVLYAFEIKNGGHYIVVGWGELHKDNSFSILDIDGVKWDMGPDVNVTYGPPTLEDFKKRADGRKID
jgi:hypothetical protein